MKKGFLCPMALMLALLLMGSALAAVRVVEPGEDFYYLDTANVLSEETEGLIYFSNQLLEQECGAQIVIAALDSIGNADIYEYALEMGNSWGIGSEENNGFLLLMTIEEDNYYAIPGSGIDGIFPASTMKELYDDYLEKDFFAKDYDAGARKFFAAVFERIADYYNADATIRAGELLYETYKTENANANSFGGAQGGSRGGQWSDASYDDYGYYEEEDEGDMLIGVVTLIFIAVIAIWAFNSNSRRGRRSGGGNAASAYWLGRMVGSASRHHHHHRPSPPPRRRNPPRPPRSGGFGGGGGRSFGGGGFGGGRGGGGGGFRGGAGRGRH